MKNYIMLKAMGSSYRAQEKNKSGYNLLDSDEQKAISTDLKRFKKKQLEQAKVLKLGKYNLYEITNDPVI